MTREPTRLLDRPSAVTPRGAGTPEDRLRALLSEQAHPTPLSPAQLARVRRGVAAKTDPRRADWNVVAWAAAGALVVATTSMGWAQSGSLGARLRDTARQVVASLIRRPGTPRQFRPALPSPAEAAVPAPALEPAPPTAPALLAEPTPPARSALTPPALPSAPQKTRTAAAQGAHPSAPPAPTIAAPSTVPAPVAALPTPPSPLALEADSLREIAGLLHTPGGAAPALEKIAIYRDHFPHGALTEEADFAELDAEVALDRRQDALGLVVQLEKRGASRPDELRILHGELLAKAGDCAGALARWGTELPASAALAERALYGRASCFATLGRTGESRAAMTEYLQRFPQGRYAAAVRTALAPKP